MRVGLGRNRGGKHRFRSKKELVIMLRKMRGGLPQKKTRAIQNIVAAETRQLLHGRRRKLRKLRKRRKRRKRRTAGMMRTARMRAPSKHRSSYQEILNVLDSIYQSIIEWVHIGSSQVFGGVLCPPGLLCGHALDCQCDLGNKGLRFTSH